MDEFKYLNNEVSIVFYRQKWYVGYTINGHWEFTFRIAFLKGDVYDSYLNACTRALKLSALRNFGIKHYYPKNHICNYSNFLPPCKLCYDQYLQLYPEHKCEYCGHFKKNKLDVSCELCVGKHSVVVTEEMTKTKSPRQHIVIEEEPKITDPEIIYETKTNTVINNDPEIVVNGDYYDMIEDSDTDEWELL